MLPPAPAGNAAASTLTPMVMNEQRPRNATIDVEAAFEHLPVPTYVVDRDGVFTWLNRAAVELIGDASGRKITCVVAPEHLHRARRELARKLIGETASSSYPLTVVAPDGRRVDVEIASVPMRDATGAVSVLGFARVREENGRACPGSAPPLTPRQHEVLCLLAEGLTTQEIAARLGVAEETARNHIRALLRQLRVHTRLEAVVEAQRNSWI